ncbi:MAG TPA: hypothetical protein VGO93_31720 [Candidatus Xenobia bacterium]|jgi:hypothetical protein
MSVAGILVLSVVGAALAWTVWRWGVDQRKALARTFSAVLAGGMGGASVGAGVGMVLGVFVGLAPGTPQNEWMVAICLGFLGLVGGAMSGLMWVQRRASQP